MTIRANPRNHENGGANMDPYEELANAIIVQACKDYRLTDTRTT